MSKAAAGASTGANLSVIKNDITARERYAAVVSNGPLLRADAIVVLCGEDSDPRLSTATRLMFMDAGNLVLLTGGRHEPPRWWGAEPLKRKLYGKGVSPRRIEVETKSANTREQAVNTVALAVARKWKRLILVASPYHQYRAFLTFVKALQDVGHDKLIQLCNVPADLAPWWKAPEGMTETRIELLAAEFMKCQQYGEHVASWADGLAYLEWWEGRDPILEAPHDPT